MQFTAHIVTHGHSTHISESLFITTSMDDHDEEKRTEQQGWGPRARGQLEDPKSWPWPLTVPALALASKWSGLGLHASASSHRSVINVLNL